MHWLEWGGAHATCGSKIITSITFFFFFAFLLLSFPLASLPFPPYPSPCVCRLINTHIILPTYSYSPHHHPYHQSVSKKVCLVCILYLPNEKNKIALIIFPFLLYLLFLSFHSFFFSQKVIGGSFLLILCR